MPRSDQPEDLIIIHHPSDSAESSHGGASGRLLDSLEIENGRQDDETDVLSSLAEASRVVHSCRNWTARRDIDESLRGRPCSSDGKSLSDQQRTVKHQIAVPVCWFHDPSSWLVKNVQNQKRDCAQSYGQKSSQLKAY